MPYLKQCTHPWEIMHAQGFQLNNSMASAEWTSTMKSYDLSHLSFLVADENVFTLSVMRKILNAFHAHEIFEAQTAHEAYEYFRLAPIDIIITDGLPAPTDEISFIHQIRNDDRSPNNTIPILMLTAQCDPFRLAAAREAGATEILTKPLTAQKLYSALQVMIEQSSEVIQTADYSGHDRRKQHMPHMGPERRRAKARVSQPEAPIRILGRDDISLKRRMDQSLSEKPLD